MAIATSLVTVPKSQKFSKCCTFVRPLYVDLVVPGHLTIVHGRVYRPWETSLFKSDIIVPEELFFCWGDS